MAVITFTPTQEGTGTPSPENVRPIIAPLNLDGIGEVYGGSLDTESGVLTETWYRLICDGSVKFAKYERPNINRFNTTLSGLGGVRHWQDSNGRQIPICNWCEGYAGYREWGAWLNAQGLLVCVPKTIDLPSDFSNYLAENPLEICYEVETPLTYTLTPAQLRQALHQLNADISSLHDSRRRILLNTPHTESTSGSIATFNTNMVGRLKSLKTTFLPVQEGSDDPSPDNVRPISGWDGVTVTRTGKNIADEDFLRDYSNYKNVGAYGYMYTDWMYLSPNTTYVYSWSDFDDDALDTCQLYITNASKYIIKNGNYTKTNLTFTTNADGSIRFSINRGNYATHQAALTAIFNNGHLQLELGSTPTDYEPYSGQSVTIDWSEDIGTVYGGYIDLVKGEVVEEWRKTNIADYYWYNFSAKQVYYMSFDKNSAFVREPCTYIYCDSLPQNIRGNAGLAEGELGYRGEGYPQTNYNNNVWIMLPEVMEFAEANEWIKTNYADVSIVYKLATPIHYPLSPQILKTLKGINNIWSDTNGEIEVTYYKH